MPKHTQQELNQLKQQVEYCLQQDRYEQAIKLATLYWLLRTSIREIDNLVFHYSPLFLCHVLLSH